LLLAEQGSGVGGIVTVGDALDEFSARDNAFVHAHT
jgi:hypothetical protein